MLWVHKSADSAFRLIRRDGSKWNQEAVLELDRKDAADPYLIIREICGRSGVPSVGICLPNELILRKSISLPSVARENLAQIVGFEIARHTPLGVDQVFFDYRITRENLSRKFLDVQLTVTPRKDIDKLLVFLQEAGYPPRAMMVMDDIEGKGHCADLLPQEMRRESSALRNTVYTAMVLVTLCIACAALLLPVWKKREQLLAIYPVIEQVAPRAEAINARRVELEKMVAQYNAPLEKKLATPSMVEVLEDLSMVIPDDTWVMHLAIRNGVVDMTGDSSTSARLIGLLERSRYLENAQFKSPLVKERGGIERFVLQADIRKNLLDNAVGKNGKVMPQSSDPPGKREQPGYPRGRV